MVIFNGNSLRRSVRVQHRIERSKKIYCFRVSRVGVTLTPLFRHFKLVSSQETP